MPKAMENVVVSCKLNGSFSYVINYRNPFNKRSNVEFDMETDAPDTWKLIAKKKVVTLEPLGFIQIPLNFTPTVIGKTHAVVSINIGKIQWTYPLTGVTETRSDKIDFNIVTQSRKLVEEDLVVGPFKGIEEEETHFDWLLL